MSRWNPQLHCEIDGCDRAHRAGGLCNMHAIRKRRHGDPAIRLVEGNGISQHNRTPEYRAWESMKYRQLTASIMMATTSLVIAVGLRRSSKLTTDTVLISSENTK